MNDCVFCKIAKGEIPSDKIYEDEKFIAFLDVNPVNYGHSLLIPKEHHKNIYGLPDKVLEEIAPLIKKIAVAVKKGGKADGINIIMNNDGTAGQIVPHAHFHIIPRLADDGYKHWVGKTFPKEESAAIAKKIRNSF